MTSIDIPGRIAAVLHDAEQCGMPEREAICAALEAIEPLRSRLIELDEQGAIPPDQCEHGQFERVLFLGGKHNGKVMELPHGQPRITAPANTWAVYVRSKIKPHVMVLLERGE